MLRAFVSASLRLTDAFLSLALTSQYVLAFGLGERGHRGITRSALGSATGWRAPVRAFASASSTWPAEG
jgi:hypothetical protein